MIDRDGIVRPDSFDEHALKLPARKRPIKIKKRTYTPNNPFYLFFISVFRCIIYAVMYPFCRIKFRLRIYGKENLKKIKKKGAVLISNHVNILDFPMFQICVCPTRKIRFVSLKSNLEIPVLGRIVKMMGALPLPDTISETKLFYASIGKYLEKNKLIQIMPEASLWKYYRDLRPFKEGAFKIAVKNKVPVLPYVFTFDLKTKVKKNGKVKRKYKTSIHILEPQTYNENFDKSMWVSELSQRCFKMMKEKIDEQNLISDSKAELKKNRRKNNK